MPPDPTSAWHTGWCNLYGPYSCPPEFLWERFLHFHFDKGILLGPNSFSTRPVMVHAWLIDHWRENRVSGGERRKRERIKKGWRWRQTEEGRMNNEERRDKENGGGVKSQGLHQQKQTSLLTRCDHEVAPHLDIEKPFDILFVYHIQFSTMLYQLILALEKDNLFVPSLIYNL